MVSYRVAGSPSRACGISLTQMPACFNRAIARSSASEEFAGQAGATRATVLICPGKIPAQASSSASFASAIDISLERSARMRSSDGSMTDAIHMR